MNDTPNVPHDLESPSPQAVSILVPTFREAANIPSLAERIHAAFSDSGIAWELLLIDDNSEDGSEAVVAELARRLPVRLVTRRQPPRDLSLSVIEGIRLCRFDRLVVMDADLSHPPERIADLLAALDADCDMVVGSRYAPGGLIDRTWSPWRLLNSRVATSLAFPLVNCSDPHVRIFRDRPPCAAGPAAGCNPSATRLPWSSWCADNCGSRNCPSTFGTAAGAPVR